MGKEGQREKCIFFSFFLSFLSGHRHGSAFGFSKGRVCFTNVYDRIGGFFLESRTQ